MARTRLSYAEAVKLLVGGTDPVTVLGRLAGGALLLATPFSETALSLFDAKGEANNLLRDLVGRAPARIRAERGRRHYELIEAAHTVLVLSAFFDALGGYIGDRLAALELTDDEKRRIGTGELRPLGSPAAVAMPDALTGFTENLPAVERALHGMHHAFREFAGGLAAARGMTMPPADGAVELALQIYREGYVRLAADVPEFEIWTRLDEHAATRAEVRRQTETLTGIAEVLRRTVDGAAPAAVEGLARHHAEALRRPLWRSDAPAPDGLTFPLVEQGFISPRFRLAVSAKDSRLSSEDWWSRLDLREDLEGFLASYLAASPSTQRPLIILGHPGAGKSLLTEVLAARIPAEAFTTVRVPLRRVDPDLPVHRQIEAAVELVTKDRISWGEFCRVSAPTTKVVLLDGFDELVQATGVTQSNYVEAVAAFQQEEWVLGRPVVVVITSRTLVMDRTVVRESTIVLKLEPFDEPQVERWTRAWNAANGSRTGFRPLTAAELWRHRDLAGQPLLLLMLAVYAAEAGDRGFDADELTTHQLYQRLLDTFIRRQVREKAKHELGDGRFTELEAASRRDLAAVAFAMFNRRRQWVDEADLGRDLEALHPESADAERGPGEPVSRARRTIAAFFFVHVAQTDDVVRTPGRRSYEFLHATFAEYLVAEHTLEVLGDLAEDWQRARRRAYGATLDDRVLRALLSHQPLTNGEQILPFVEAMIMSMEEGERAALGDVVVELFRTARRYVADGEYRPTPFDAVNRLAAYTANLVLLGALCRRGGISVAELCGGDDGSGIATTVSLWRSGLHPEVQKAFFNTLIRVDDSLRINPGTTSTLPELREAQLVGDSFMEAVLGAGVGTLQMDTRGSVHRYEMTPFQRECHIQVVRICVFRRPIMIGNRLTPWDERLYARFARWLEKSERKKPHPETVTLLANYLVMDGGGIAAETFYKIFRLALLPDGAGGINYSVALLVLHYPELLRLMPSLKEDLMSFGSSVMMYEIARERQARDPEMLDEIVDSYRKSLMKSGDISAGRVTASMVVGLKSIPALIPSLLEALMITGPTSWPQVNPKDLMAAVGNVDVGLQKVQQALTDYIETRGDSLFDGEDLEAFERIKQLVQRPNV
ncbi:NACHT domain-containing protein [Actinoplanes italicus]|uniref:NACHT domain-containing protein n=1 Tax=Actinoplanes italicus TaxID=113567 RepID=UPI0011B20274|nr:hypothetical protein [Actinoplanes italicus]